MKSRRSAELAMPPHSLVELTIVWFTILKQLCFYLRKHKDDKEVAELWDNLDGKTTESLYAMFTMLIEKWMRTQFSIRSKAGWLLDWVRPEFTTVSGPPIGTVGNPSDAMLANALIIASSSPSSEPFPEFPCKNGFPSITLDGTQDDWKKILTKIELLGNFGKEPKIYTSLHRPVLSRFVETFDKPNHPAIRLFWNDIVTATPRQLLCDKTELITGWINAFHMWDPAGSLAITTSFAVAASDAVNLDGNYLLMAVW
jgi:hypothetical protein